MRIIEYLGLWKKNMIMTIASWMEYRSDFIMVLVSMILFNMVSIVFYWVIFQNVIEINGWNLGQLIFLSGFLSLSLGIWHTFFWGFSTWNFERYVKNGELDRVLVRPYNAFLAMLISGFNVGGFGDIAAGLIILYIGSTMSGIVWTFTNILLMTILLTSSVIILTAISSLIAILGFWVTRVGDLGGFIWKLTDFAEVPLDIYNPFIIFIFTFVLPLGFVSYYPSEVFLQQGIFIQLSYLTPFIAIIYFTLTYQFWKFGLKRYTSTGS